jgi:hypothetical protein
VGAALRGVFGRRGVTVVAPPAYPVVAGRSNDLSGEIVVADATLVLPVSARSVDA